MMLMLVVKMVFNQGRFWNCHCSGLWPGFRWNTFLINYTNTMWATHPCWLSDIWPYWIIWYFTLFDIIQSSDVWYHPIIWHFTLFDIVRHYPIIWCLISSNHLTLSSEKPVGNPDLWEQPWSNFPPLLQLPVRFNRSLHKQSSSMSSLSSRSSSL